MNSSKILIPDMSLNAFNLQKKFSHSLEFLRKITINLFCLVVLVLLMISCNNEYEPVFDKPAHERVSAALNEFRSTLVNAPNGWKAFIYPGSKGGYMLYLDFKEDGSVTMISDFNDSTAEMPMEGTFVMKALQRPTLTFDTYSYIHLLSDPDGIVNSGPVGEGLTSDFEFAIDTTNADSIRLDGIKNNTEMTIVQASESEQEAFLAGIIKESRVHASGYFANDTHTFFETNQGDVIPIGISDNTKIFTLFYMDNNLLIQKIELPFNYSADGILLKYTVSVRGLNFRELLWDENLSNYYILAGNEKMFLQGSPSFISFSQALPPVVESLGSQYKTMVIDQAIGRDDNSAGFNTIYDEAAQNVQIEMAAYDLTLGEIFISFKSPTTAIIAYLLYQNGTGYLANFNYTLTTDAADRLRFNFVSMNENADLARNSLLPLVNYFESEPITMEYFVNTQTGDLMTRVYPQSAPENYFYSPLLEEEFQ